MEVFGLVIGFGIIILVIIGAFYARWYEKKIWNKGACPVCKQGFWKSFDMDSSGATGYSCTHCNNSCWISYGVDK